MKKANLFLNSLRAIENIAGIDEAVYQLFKL